MMKKRTRFYVLTAFLAFIFLFTAVLSGLGAEEPTAEEILAEAEAEIEALEAPTAVKERLRTMTQTWRRDGEKAGLTGEQLRELIRAMVRVGANCDPARERLRLRSVCRLMVREMKEGGSAAAIAAQICARLAAGETLARALKAVEREMHQNQEEKQNQAGQSATGTGGAGSPGQGGGQTGAGGGSAPGGPGGKA